MNYNNLSNERLAELIATKHYLVMSLRLYHEESSEYKVIQSQLVLVKAELEKRGE